MLSSPKDSLHTCPRRHRLPENTPPFLHTHPKWLFAHSQSPSIRSPHLHTYAQASHKDTPLFPSLPLHTCLKHPVQAPLAYFIHIHAPTQPFAHPPAPQAPPVLSECSLAHLPFPQPTTHLYTLNHKEYSPRPRITLGTTKPLALTLNLA